MSDVAMPEPAAYLYVSPNGNAVNVRSYDDIAPGVNKFGLITTDQAEAYKDACVRGAIDSVLDILVDCHIDNSQLEEISGKVGALIK